MLLRSWHLLAFLCLFLCRIRLVSGEDGEPLPAQCKVVADFRDCNPDATTRATALFLPNTTDVSAYFYAVNQELWFSYTTSVTGRVTVQLHSTYAAPYVETLVYRDNIMAHMAELQYTDRDARAIDTIHRWTVGTWIAGTTFWLRIRVIDWPTANVENDDMRDYDFLLLRPSVHVQPIQDIAKPSSTCGDNCEARCEYWGGIDLDRQANGFAVAQCIHTSAPNLAPCQCFCQDGRVGDVHGSDSCQDDKGLQTGGIVGIVIAIILVILLVTVPLWYNRKRQQKREGASAAPTASTKRHIDFDKQKEQPHKDKSETELNTETHDDEEQGLYTSKTLTMAKEQAPASAWDAVLSLPNADVLYTKVIQLSDGSIVVKRKFKLHQPTPAGKTTKRLKVLFPDIETAHFNGFYLTGQKKSANTTGEPTETTESESEAEHGYIQEVPSILPSVRTPEQEESNETEALSAPQSQLAKKRHTKTVKSQKILHSNSQTLQQEVDATEQRMAKTTTSKTAQQRSTAKKVARPKSRATESPSNQ